MTETVSNEQLLVDIDNTEKERDAYQKIASGFETISNLPETENKLWFVTQANMAWSREKCCTELLELLREIRRERGL
jgi:hypothetical protein